MATPDMRFQAGDCVTFEHDPHLFIGKENPTRRFSVLSVRLAAVLDPYPAHPDIVKIELDETPHEFSGWWFRKVNQPV